MLGETTFNKFLSFNRTFMELKYIGGAITGLGAIVLIVPLWN